MAKRAARLLLRGVMEKHVDSTTKRAYYFNVKTKQSFWHKPAILGAEDLDVVRSSIWILA